MILFFERWTAGGEINILAYPEQNNVHHYYFLYSEHSAPLAIKWFLLA